MTVPPSKFHGVDEFIERFCKTVDIDPDEHREVETVVAMHEAIDALPDLKKLSVRSTVSLQGNRLENLNGLPRAIGEDLVVKDNKLTHLEDLAGVVIAGDLSVQGNPITHFGGAFAQARIGGDVIVDFAQTTIINHQFLDAGLGGPTMKMHNSGKSWAIPFENFQPLFDYQAAQTASVAPSVPPPASPADSRRQLDALPVFRLKFRP